MFRRDVGNGNDEGGDCFDFYCNGFDSGGSRLRMIFTWGFCYLLLSVLPHGGVCLNCSFGLSVYGSFGS